MKRIYLDTAAGTPVAKEVWRAMKPFWTKNFGNPSGIHTEGEIAGQALAEARQAIAGHLAARSSEIIFTAGGTESNNLAIFGVAGAWQKKAGRPGHIITTKIEHKSVLRPVAELAKRGWAVDYLPLRTDGSVDLVELEKTLRPNTALVSVGYVNNEIGTIAPLKKISRLLRRQTSKIYFHTDACQAPRFLPIRPNDLGVDLLTANAAKIYGPKGAGLLYARQTVPLEALLVGGGQEAGRRSGTENVPAVVGLARALTLCEKLREKETARLTILRDYLITEVLRLVPEVAVNGGQDNRVANNANFYLPGLSAERLVIELDARGIACSTGSACSSNDGHESHVVAAVNPAPAAASASLRFSLGRETTKRQINYLLRTLPPLVQKLRADEQWQKSLAEDSKY
ncbi:MAG: cysteine desulfurase family protein [Candidatus Paceibacterota bacterium]